MMTFRRTAALSWILTLPVLACGGGAPDAAADEEAAAPAEGAAEVDLGPMEYDASGTMPCSVGGPAFDEACGWRVVRDGSGGAEIWISNIASETKPAYRVLRYADGAFTTRDGTPLEVTQDGDMWTVSAQDGGFFRFPEAVVTGG